MKPEPNIIAVTVNVELPTETAVLINKFVALNQHTRNAHGPMSSERSSRCCWQTLPQP
jgi:hypothetical protein